MTPINASPVAALPDHDNAASHPACDARHTRRRLLVGAASAALAAFAVAVLPAAAEAVTQTGYAEPDPHPTWHAEWRALVNWMDGPACPHQDLDEDVPEWARSVELEDLIIATPARSAAGVVAQLRLIVHYAPGHDWRGREGWATPSPPSSASRPRRRPMRRPADRRAFLALLGTAAAGLAVAAVVPPAAAAPVRRVSDAEILAALRALTPAQQTIAVQALRRIVAGEPLKEVEIWWRAQDAALPTVGEAAHA